jgi:hypothetical protein
MGNANGIWDHTAHEYRNRMNDGSKLLGRQAGIAVTVTESEAMLVGYSALIAAFELNVPLPERLALISHQHRRYEAENWAVYTPRHMPDDTIAGHLAFALRYEGVDLAVLHALFICIGHSEIEAWVKSEPVGRYSRRAWFFYEWLMDKKL